MVSRSYPAAATKTGWMRADLSGIPGLRRELVIALIKSLPKPVRRNFVPANYAEAFLGRVAPLELPLLDALERVGFRRMTSTHRWPRRLELGIRCPSHRKSPSAWWTIKQEAAGRPFAHR